MDTFFLGTHKDTWLKRTDVPLFVSHRRLRDRVNLPRAIGPWALDSGGFTELERNHTWTVTSQEYVAAVRTYAEEIGNLTWAAPQDWMCEPAMLKGTGLTVHRHQLLTVYNYLDLRNQAPELPFIPVLQGWDLADYLRCVERYQWAGVDLFSCPVVGVGSVCRRQATDEIATIMGALAGLGLRLHGFGVKSSGLQQYGGFLVSSDSMAWSLDARRSDPLPGHRHRSCSNCMEYALAWRQRLLRRIT